VFLPYLSGLKIACAVITCILSSVACLLVPYFSTLSHKRHDFRKGLFSLQILSVKFLILRRIKRCTMKMYIGLRVNHPLFFCHILMKLEFSRYIFKKFSNTKFHYNVYSGSRVVPCGRTDRQTDNQTDRHDKVNSRFSQFCHRFSKLPMLSTQCIVWFLDWSLYSINRLIFVAERRCLLKAIHIHCVVKISCVC
jgi:hypothetical protein